MLVQICRRRRVSLEQPAGGGAKTAIAVAGDDERCHHLARVAADTYRQAAENTATGARGVEPGTGEFVPGAEGKSIAAPVMHRALLHGNHATRTARIVTHDQRGVAQAIAAAIAEHE